MNAFEFLAEYRPKLVRTLQRYLGGDISYQAVSDFAWLVISFWEEQNIPPSAPYVEGEHLFWAAVWSTQHLADEDHWNDGCTQQDLKRYLELLQTNGDLESHETGLRPSAN